MNLEDYLKTLESKYAVIRYSSYLLDPVAQEISPDPRRFIYQDIEFVILSLEQDKIPALVQYATQHASGIEFELTIGSGKVTLLTLQQILSLLE